MKSKVLIAFAYLLLLCIAIINKANAQQNNNYGAVGHPHVPMFNTQAGATFSFHVFMAPNKSYGYNILNNARVIYHQPAFPRVPGDHDIVITRKEEADIAA